MPVIELNVEDLTDHEYEIWLERASIMEFDGNMTRREAEQRAYEEILAKRKLKI